ncbi:hypothetical protein Fmac_024867 [Flemingia macrophylla]|uniref:Uncharacterized protein n=1 Tax=Flemingia macrophylla TaxID=520843 RepID=A0ABD1LQL1_9FABA
MRGVHDVATDTSAETRKVEGKLDALVKLVTQLAVNQKPASVARYPEAYAANIYSRPPQLQRPDTLEEFTMWLRYIAETRKVEGKLDALVNLVTQLAVNQKPASVARGRWLPTPSNFGAINDVIVIRGIHNVAIDTSAEARKVEGKLDALVNLVTQLVVNQKPTSVARLPTPSSFGAINDVIVIRGVHDVATDTSAETRKVEGKLDGLVNLVTQLAMNQKPASVARVCGDRSSNYHHRNVFPSS